jgi:cell division protein FtsI (penicillin-binding protein 3)
MKNYKDFSRRVSVLIAIMGLWGMVIGTRLYFLHIVESADLKVRAENQQQRTLDVSPRRGVIYDRNGNELAVSIKVDSVFAVPDEISDPAVTAARMSQLTGLSRGELLKKFSSEKSFIWIKRKLSDGEATAIRDAKLAGIYFQKEDQRFYPKRELASHVLGYVNMDGEGMGGLEYRYNDSVRGEGGKVVVVTDARGRSFSRVEQQPLRGANLVTTIDENIQYIVEKELKETVRKTRAKGISIVAMDPRTGEILGMANYPQFNPNEYGKYSPDSWKNRAVTDMYEPGSTFKIVTAAAALEEHLTSPDELIDCQMGSIVIFGHRIHDHKPFGILTVKQVMQNSSDVGMIKLGLRLGDERFARYIDRMGFGRRTNIDLPGEARGQIRPPARWSKISVGAISMGQEVGVTPLQIVSLVSSVANGGILYQPYVVKKVEHPESGTISESEPHGVRVMSAATAEQLKDMLEFVVTDGTAKASRLDGYRAAGKTGTAQKIDETGRYSKTKFVASFAGYAPASNPVLSMIVMIDEPSGGYHGGDVAAPVFKRIAEQVLRYKAIAPDVPEYAPRYTEKNRVARPAPRPEPRQIAPRPAVPPAGKDYRVFDAAFNVKSASAGYELGGIAVPDFYGKSLREVTEECLKLGLRLRSSGSGAAIEQFPGPGSRVQAGAGIQIVFSTRR